MRYSNDEAMREIMARKDRIARKRDARRIRVLGGATALLALALVLTLSRLTVPSDHAASSYGAFLLSAQAGGYVLAGVLCFALGVVFTLLCSRIREGSRKKRKEKNDQQEVGS